MNAGRGRRRGKCSQSRRKNRVAVKHAGLNRHVGKFRAVGSLNQNFSVAEIFRDTSRLANQRVRQTQIVRDLPNDIAKQIGTCVGDGAGFSLDGNFADGRRRRGRIIFPKSQVQNRRGFRHD